MNTTEQHQTQINKVLEFIKKAKFTTAKHLQLAANRNRRGLPTQLMEKGLLLKREMSQGLTIFGLSKAGAELMGVPRFDLYNVRLGTVDHSLIAQYETITSLDLFNIDNYEFEPQTHSHDYRPDVLWDTSNGEYFIEVEISPKSIDDGEMDRFFHKILSRRTIVVFKEMAIHERYLKRAKHYVVNGIPEWECINKRWVKTGQVIKYSREEWDRVLFREHRTPGVMSVNEYLDEGLC